MNTEAFYIKVLREEVREFLGLEKNGKDVSRDQCLAVVDLCERSPERFRVQDDKGKWILVKVLEKAVEDFLSGERNPKTATREVMSILLGYQRFSDFKSKYDARPTKENENPIVDAEPMEPSDPIEMENQQDTSPEAALKEQYDLIWGQAMAYLRENAFDLARTEFDVAHRIWPSRKTKEALDICDKRIVDHTKALAYMEHYSSGIAYLEQRRFRKAEHEFRTANAILHRKEAQEREIEARKSKIKKQKKTLTLGSIGGATTLSLAFAVFLVTSSLSNTVSAHSFTKSAFNHSFKSHDRGAIEKPDSTLGGKDHTRVKKEDTIEKKDDVIGPSIPYPLPSKASLREFLRSLELDSLSNRKGTCLIGSKAVKESNASEYKNPARCLKLARAALKSPFKEGITGYSEKDLAMEYLQEAACGHRLQSLISSTSQDSCIYYLRGGE